MKKLILLIFAMIANVFAGEWQETLCKDKSLVYCINHFDRQCKAKNYGACNFVGILYTEQEQYSKAKKYYKMVCDNADSKDTSKVEFVNGMMMELPAITYMQVSCGDLGNFYYNGWGARQNYEKAFQYYKKACDLGSGSECAKVGNAYYFGKGVKKDLKSAIKFFTSSCELEDSGGCGVLGVFYHEGEGVKQNLSKAKELYGKACDFGNQIGCDEYKKLKEKGY